MRINRPLSDLWIWGLPAAAVLILLLGEVVGPRSTEAERQVSGEVEQVAPVPLEPIEAGPESYPILSEPRQTGLKDAFEQEQAAREVDSAL